MSETEASTTWSRAAWDVCVVGAGPAGSIAAREAARRGLSTILIDRRAFPRDKVCGGCLGRPAIEALRSVGLGHVVDDVGGEPFSSILVGAMGRRASIVVPEGRVVIRSRFDDALCREAVRAGATFASRATVVSTRAEGNGRVVRVRDDLGERDVVARCVIVATGLGGGGVVEDAPRPPPERLRIGVGAIVRDESDAYPPGTIHMAWAPAGYAGVVRADRSTLDVAAAVDAGAFRGHRDPASLVDSLLAAAGFAPIDGLRDAGLKGTARLRQRPGRVAGRRLFLAGDAAGYVEPFTGEGMAWAIASGAGVAAFAAEGVRGWRDEISEAWTSWHGSRIRRRQRVCRLVSAAVGSPTLAPVALGVLARSPTLAAPFVRRIHAGYDLGARAAAPAGAA